MAGGYGRIRHYQLTIGSGATQFSAALTDGQENPQFQRIWIQPDDGNSGVVYVGGDNTVTSALHGFSLEVPATNVPPLITTLEGPFHLSDLWAAGTENDVLNIIGLVSNG